MVGVLRRPAYAERRASFAAYASATPLLLTHEQKNAGRSRSFWTPTHGPIRPDNFDARCEPARLDVVEVVEVQAA